MDRRSFIKATAIGGGAAAAAGGAIALWPGALPYSPREPLFVLDPPRFAVLAAVAARTPALDGLDPVTVAHAADVALRAVAPEAQGELRDALDLLENGLTGLVLRGSPRPFTTLSPEERDRALERWLDSRVELVRGAGQALRKLTLGAAYAPLAVAQTTGYPGPLFEKPDPGPITARGPLSPPFDPAALHTGTATTAGGGAPPTGAGVPPDGAPLAPTATAAEGAR